MVHVETVQYALFIPVAGPVRKPKYVESPRVPGEAALGLQRRPETGEPSASGEHLPGECLSVCLLSVCPLAGLPESRHLLLSPA